MLYQIPPCSQGVTWAVLIYGDTNTGLAVIPAKRREIPIFHMQAAIVASIKECRKKSISIPSITCQTSICQRRNMHAAILRRGTGTGARNQKAGQP
jgi:hypothetical protein